MLPKSSFFPVFVLGMTLAPLSPDFHADGGGCGLDGEDPPMDEYQEAPAGDAMEETQPAADV